MNYTFIVLLLVFAMITWSGCPFNYIFRTSKTTNCHVFELWSNWSTSGCIALLAIWT